MALPDFRINPYVTAPAPGLSEQFGQVTAQRMQDYDTNLAAVDIWADQNAKLKQSVAPFIRDQAYADQIMQQTKGQIDQLAESGDYENASRQIKKGATQFANQVQPLLQNQQRFAQYSTELDELRKAGKVGYDTIQKARAYSTKDYEGIDPNNPQGSMFSGFVPTEDVNVSEKVNKFIEGWKADAGAGPIVLSSDGLTFTRQSWEGANPKVIDKAIRDYLDGDTEYKTYRDTQGIIGNTPRVTDETENAIAAAREKAGFSRVDPNEAWTPEHVWKKKQADNMLTAVPPAASAGSPNPLAVDKYDALGVTLDPKTGKLITTALIEKGEDGKLYKYVNKDGKIMGKHDFMTESSLPATGAEGIASIPEWGTGLPSAEDRGYTKVEVSQEESDAMSKSANVSNETWAGEKWFREQIRDPNIGEQTKQALMDAQRSSSAKQAFLALNKHLYTTPKYLTDAYVDYKEAMKNSKVIASNRTFNVSEVPNSTPPKATSLVDDVNLANINGKPVGILSNDPEYTEFQVAGGTVDLNSVIDKVSEKNKDYQWVGMRMKGPMVKNPYSNDKGAIQYEMIWESKENKAPKIIPVAVTVDDPQLQILNKVTSLASIGEGGQVEFDVPAAKLGPNGTPRRAKGIIQVVAGSSIDQFGQKVFHNYIEIMGPDGQKIETGMPQNMTLPQFEQYYQAVLVPDLVSKNTTLKD